jgi:nucleoside-diphosphate-sugar epimerase
MHVSIRRHSDHLALWTGDPERIMLRFSEDPRAAAARLPKRTTEKATVLLLGANGFIGMHALHALLGDDRIGRVYALVRSRNNTPGEARIARQVKKYGLALRGTEKLTVVEGASTEPLMGLEPARYHELCRAVDAVIDATGATNHTYSYSRYRREKIEPLLRLIEFCFQERSKSLHVVGSIGGEVYKRRRDFFRYSFFHCGYSKAKWVVKHIGLHASAHGVPIHVYQTPFVLGGRSAGFKDPGMQYSFWHMIWYALQIGRIWQSDHAIPIVSADVLAGAFVDNLLSARPRNLVYPVTPVTNVEIAERFGLEVVPWPEFRATLVRRVSFGRGQVDWTRPLPSAMRIVKHSLFARSLFPRSLPHITRNIDISIPSTIGQPTARIGLRPIDVVFESARRIGKLKRHTRELVSVPAEMAGTDEKAA